MILHVHSILFTPPCSLSIPYPGVVQMRIATTAYIENRVVGIYRNAT
jgi:hypothetical protein